MFSSSNSIICVISGQFQWFDLFSSCSQAMLQACDQIGHSGLHFSSPCPGDPVICGWPSTLGPVLQPVLLNRLLILMAYSSLLSWATPLLDLGCLMTKVAQVMSISEFFLCKLTPFIYISHIRYIIFPNYKYNIYS